MDEQQSPAEIEQSAFDAAVSKLAAMDKDPDDVPEPPPPPDEGDDDGEPPAQTNKHPEGEKVVETDPGTEPAPEGEAPADATAKAPDEEFVEFQGAQLKRFNSVYGRMRQLERELLDARRASAPTPAPSQSLPQQPAVPTPQPAFIEPQPKLADFANVEQWAQASTEWAARKARFEVSGEMQGMFTQQQIQSEREREQAALTEFVNGKISEGQKKFGQAKFNQTCNEVCSVIPQEAFFPAVQRLMRLQNYPDVVMELAKNLPLAERIFLMSLEDQIYELKDLDRKVAAHMELTKKQTNGKPTPTKVEAAGQGAPVRSTAQTLQTIRKDLRNGGGVNAAARYFMAMDKEQAAS